MTTSIIEIETVNKQLPLFSTNISQHASVLQFAAKAIFEEKDKNEKVIETNVKSYFVSSYDSHLQNKNFQPLIDLVLSFCSEVSKTQFKTELEFECYNCWGMLYNEGDHAVQHSHYPSLFSAVVYLHVEEDSSPIIFEKELTVIPKTGSLILFPGILNHVVPKTKGRRMVVGMNIDRKL
jgi:hypothetical protein